MILTLGVTVGLNIGSSFGNMGGKMKVKIVDRKVRLRRAVSEKLNLVEILKTSARQKIEGMVEAEEVEDV